MRIKNNLNFKAVENKVKAAIGVYADTEAKRMEAYAKSSKPWTDRTANAKNSIQGDFGWKGSKATISLSGNVDYFVYLELAMGKRYSILRPTIDRHAAAILRGYQRLVR